MHKSSALGSINNLKYHKVGLPVMVVRDIFINGSARISKQPVTGCINNNNNNNNKNYHYYFF